MTVRRAFTLVEIMVAVLVGSLVIYGATSLLSSGLKTGTKGSAHLTNLQGATIFLAQLETDLSRCSTVISPSPGATDVSLQLEVWEADTAGKIATSTIFFLPSSDGRGFLRRRLAAGAGAEDYVFSRTQMTAASFTSMEMADTGRVGVMSSFVIRSPGKGEEEFSIQRFMLCGNSASNSICPGWNR